MHELIAAKQAVWRTMIDKELAAFRGNHRICREDVARILARDREHGPDKEIDLVLDKAGLGKFFHDHC
jgi:hypothetical protein